MMLFTMCRFLLCITSFISESQKGFLEVKKYKYHVVKYWKSLFTYVHYIIVL